MFSLHLERFGIPLGRLVKQSLNTVAILQRSLDLGREFLGNINAKPTFVHSTEQHVAGMALSLLARRTPLSDAPSSPSTQ
jgi:hypothetical protein